MRSRLPALAALWLAVVAFGASQPTSAGGVVRGGALGDPAVWAIHELQGVGQLEPACECCLHIDLGTHPTATDSDERWLLKDIPTVGSNLKEPVHAVSPVPADWHVPASGEWVSVSSTGFGPLGTYGYVFEFTIPGGCYDRAILEAWFSGHEDVEFRLDGAVVGGAPAVASGSLHTTGVSHLLAPGFHRIEARVTAGPTPVSPAGFHGFLAEGSVRAARDLDLDLSTGVGAIPGNPPVDDDWRIVSGPPGCCGPLAYVIPNPPVGTWTGGNGLAAAWINHSPTGALNGPGSTVNMVSVPYVYRTQFLIPQCAWLDGQPLLTMRFTADNSVTMRLDGAPIASANSHTMTGSYSDVIPPSNLLLHTLEAHVLNADPGSPTGLIVEATVTATCDCL